MERRWRRQLDAGRRAGGTACTGGPFDRATDPWLSFSPNGTLHAMSLVTYADPTTTGGFGDNGVTYNRSADGGVNWEPFQLVIEDTDPRILNDKKQHHCGPERLALRLRRVGPRPGVGREIIHPAYPIGLGFKGPIYFTRTTNGGNSWEPARKIYETGANKQTNVVPLDGAAQTMETYSRIPAASSASSRPVNPCPRTILPSRTRP